MIKKKKIIVVIMLFFSALNSLFANDSFYLTAESIKKNNQNNTITAIGKVNVRFDKTRLKADKIIYSRKNNEVIAKGNVIIFYDNGDVLYAKEAKLKENLKNGFIKSIGILLSNDSRLAASSAESLEGKNKTIYKNVVFTNCRNCKKKETLWKLKAKRATHLKNSKVILYENVYLEFFKIPILYVPVFYHPDPTVKSKTGLLAPKVSNSSIFGTVYDQPIFFNISNRSNLTLNTKLSSKEGILLAKDYNKISTSSELNIKSSFTRGSKERINEPTKKEFRGHLNLKYYNKLNERLLVGTNIKRSSDKSYLAKYGFSEGESVLNQNVFLESGNIYKNISFDIFKFQSLSEEYTTSNLPFIRPYFSLSWNNLNNQKRKRNYNNKITFNSITRNNNQNVDTINFESKSNKNYSFNGLLFKNLVKFNLNLYSRNGTTNNKNLLKFFPQTGLEFQYPMIKNMKYDSLLLEPRAQFYLSPDDFKNYKIRNEDSLDVDLSSSNLFDINRYSGQDRIESGIRANYGVILRKISSEGNSLSGSIGQTYNNNKQQLFNNFSGFGNKTSEIVGNIMVDNNIHELNYDFRFSEKLKLNRNSLEAISNHESLSLNLSYIQLKNFASARHEDTEQIRYGFSKKLFKNWQVSMGQLRDLAGAHYSVPLKTNLSLNFSNECALIEINYIRDKSYNVDIPAVTNLNFIVKLFGF